MLGNDKVYRQLKAFIASAAYDLQLRDDIVKGLVSRWHLMFYMGLSDVQQMLQP